MDLVYFSPVNWISFEQRPHKFVRWYHSKYGAQVLWVDPYPTRLPSLKDVYRLGSKENITSSSELNWLKVVNPGGLPIEPLPGSSVVNGLFWKKIMHELDQFAKDESVIFGVGKPSLLSLKALRQHGSLFSFYDCMDNFPSFYSGVSRISMDLREKQLADRVNHIMVSSSFLVNKFKQYNRKISLVLNACDSAGLPSISSIDKVQESAVLGYVGMINDWFDWQLLIGLAESNPSYCVRLIGPVQVPCQKTLPSNVEMLPACRHSLAIEAMSKFSVGLIPFKLNELTETVDPIKYYEYRGLGLPVLSSKFGEMAVRNEQDGVFFMSAESDLQKAVREAVLYKAADDDVNIFREENSWSHRFNSIDFLPTH